MPSASRRELAVRLPPPQDFNEAAWDQFDGQNNTQNSSFLDAPGFLSPTCRAWGMLANGTAPPLPGGIAATGPAVVWSERRAALASDHLEAAFPPTFVLSPLRNAMALNLDKEEADAAATAAAVRFGLTGNTSFAPAGFSATVGLWLGRGVNGAMEAWGSAARAHAAGTKLGGGGLVRRRAAAEQRRRSAHPLPQTLLVFEGVTYFSFLWSKLSNHPFSLPATAGLFGAQASARRSDVTLQYLGYSTDNGAYYYYNTAPGLNYQETMVRQGPLGGGEGEREAPLVGLSLEGIRLKGAAWRETPDALTSLFFVFRQAAVRRDADVLGLPFK